MKEEQLGFFSCIIKGSRDFCPLHMGKKGVFHKKTGSGMNEKHFPIEELCMAKQAIPGVCGDEKREVPTTCQRFGEIARNE